MVNLIATLSNPLVGRGPHTGPADFATREEAYQAGIDCTIAAIDKGET
jgi:hypothetical protein